MPIRGIYFIEKKPRGKEDNIHLTSYWGFVACIDKYKHALKVKV